jgi:hypothetical protein
MRRKHLRFALISEALSELKSTLAMQSELKQRDEIEPLLKELEDFDIRND